MKITLSNDEIVRRLMQSATGDEITFEFDEIELGLRTEI